MPLAVLLLLHAVLLAAPAGQDPPPIITPPNARTPPPDDTDAEAGGDVDAPAAAPEPMPTVAEASGYARTATSAEVVAFVERLAAEAPDVVRTAEMGRSHEDRPLPLLILADPPVENAEEARASGRAIVFVYANIHAGEVCGKEAMLALARDLTRPVSAERRWLDDVILVLLPNYNPDGNDRMAPDNRPGQNGPETMGRRPNAQGLDLNRDWVKLEAPETRAMVAFLNEWDPHVIVDLHTTNGSWHRYTLTYEVPTNPSGHAPSIAYLRETLLPEVAAQVRARTGYDTFYYGNFNRTMDGWYTYSAEPRFGGPYHGLRGQMSILSEAYSYATFEDRIRCTRAFVEAIVDFVAGRRDEVIAMHESARTAITAAGLSPSPEDLVGIRHVHAAWPDPVIIRGYEMEAGVRGRPRPTGRHRNHTVQHFGRFEATLSVPRPIAYVIPPGHEAVIEKLRQHGIEMQPYVGRASVEVSMITAINRDRQAFQGHRQVSVECSTSTIEQAFEAGSMIVPTSQPLGTLAVYLLEPQSADGLLNWNFFDGSLEVGAPFPVVRVRAPSDLR